MKAVYRSPSRYLASTRSEEELREGMQEGVRHAKNDIDRGQGWLRWTRVYKSGDPRLSFHFICLSPILADPTPQCPRQITPLGIWLEKVPRDRFSRLVFFPTLVASRCYPLAEISPTARKWEQNVRNCHKTGKECKT